MRRLFPFLLFILLISCDHDEVITFPESDPIIGLASPVKLDLGQTEIILKDYFLDVDPIDSVKIGGVSVLKGDDFSSVLFDGSAVSHPFMEMEVWMGNDKYSIPVMASKKVQVDFELDPMGANYTAVALAGEFNGWTPSRTPLSFSDGKWKTTLYLDKGAYQYQVDVGGESWILDPSNPDSVDNNMGGFNSVFYAGKKDKPEPLQIFTDDAEGDAIEVDFSGAFTEAFVFWQNFRIPSEYLEFDSGENEFEFDIPEQARESESTVIRIWAFDDNGISNDIMIPLHYGKVVTDPELLSRTDYRKAIMYNAFVDRFNNADPGNDRPLNTPEVLPPADYHGGDIAGITEKIEDGYFASLGVNTLWISPIVKNPEEAFGFWPEPESKFSGYHGYWPISFTEIDDRYGTEKEFTELVSAAHDNNMNALLDIVANHVHEQHPMYQQHPEWATDLYLPDGTLNTEKWDEHRLTTWFDVFLPTLNLEKIEVTEMLSDSALWWLKTYHLDGFRHDATKHIPEIFWRTLTSKVKKEIVMEEGRPVYQLGETYGSPQLISSYISTGMLDAQFDFNVYDAALGAFARDEESFQILHNRLSQSLEYYGYHNLMGNITGNQDRGRFISYAGGELKFEEDAKAAGWTRKIGVGDHIAYNKLQMLMAFNMTIPGIPVIYYGDEFGMPGGNDPDSRRMMKFGGLSEKELQTRETTSTLAMMRSTHMSLIYGDFFPIIVDDLEYVFGRRYFDETAVVLFNKNSEERIINLDMDELDGDEVTEFIGKSYKLLDDSLEVSLPPMSFAIVILKD